MRGTGSVEPEEKFHRNLEYIKKTYPSLHGRLLRSRPSLELARSGSPTLKVGGIYIESKHDPEAGAERVAAGSAGEHEVAVFLGCGLGYHVNTLFRKRVRRAVLIEKNPLIFHAALYVIEPDYLRSLLPLIDADPCRIEECIRPVLKKAFTLVKHAQSIQLVRDYYRSIELIIRRGVKESIASMVTELGMQRLWVRNILKNLFRREGRFGATRDLAGAFSGPVLLLASGPFLEDVIQHVRRVKARIPLFALLPSLPYLLQQGVRPDLIVSTDPGFGNLYRFVRDSDIPLVSTYSACPGLLKNWKGKVMLFSHGLPFEQKLLSLNRWSMCIPMQGTSSAVMVLLAKALGFAPVYLAGFDFAYRGLKDHHLGAGFEAVHLAHTDRFSPWQTLVFAHFRRDLPVAGNASSGTRIYSTHKLMLYCEWVNRELSGEGLFRIGDGLAMENLQSVLPEHLALTGRGAREEFLRIISRVGDGYIPAGAFEEDVARIEKVLGLDEAESYRMIYGGDSKRGAQTQLQGEIAHLRHLFYTYLQKKRARA